jgi:hypothetical protein
MIMALRDPVPSEAIATLLRQEALSGRTLIKTREIARRLRMSNKVVGQRVGRLLRDGVDGLRISKYSDSGRGTVWVVEVAA